MSIWVRRFSDRLDAAMKSIALMMLVIMVLLVGLQVVARYVFFSAPSWTEEL